MKNMGNVTVGQDIPKKKDLDDLKNNVYTKDEVDDLIADSILGGSD